MTPKEELKELNQYIAFFEDKLALSTKRSAGQLFRRSRSRDTRRLSVARARKRALEQILKEKEAKP